ncbi:hypothetical protein ABZX75_33260 [Streptomyces sp. NPDC003038]|uniref:hypothetical protein n=1 Tax=unclassified Streptomyces TaxID=2593676 RepID=UPI00339E5873
MATLLANRYAVTSISLGAALGVGAMSAVPASAASLPGACQEEGCNDRDRRDVHIGVDQNVYFANDAGQDLYVIPAPDPGYAVADMGIDIGAMFLGVGEIKKGYQLSVGLPETIKTVSDLYKYMKVSGAYLSGTAAVGFRSAEGSEAGVEAGSHEDLAHYTGLAGGFADDFKRNAVRIPSGEYRNVMDKGLFTTWLNPASGWMGMAGGKAANFMVMTGDGKQITQFDGAPDESWIAGPNGIVRSEYGTVWEPNPQAGQHGWDTAQ